MRGIVSRLVIPLAAIAALTAVGSAGGAGAKDPTFVFAGASDPTYLDPALVSDGESFPAHLGVRAAAKGAPAGETGAP